MRGELKKYELRASKRPAKKVLVSATALVRNTSGETGYCYINFSADFELFVARKLQFGLHPTYPAYIAIDCKSETCFEIGAQYVDGTHRVPLWTALSKPSWLNFYKGQNHHGANSQNKAGSPRRTRRGSTDTESSNSDSSGVGS